MNRRNGGGGHWQHCECGLFCYGELLVFGGTYCRTLFAAITKSFLTGPLESFFVLAYRHPNTPVPLTMSAHAPLPTSPGPSSFSLSFPHQHPAITHHPITCTLNNNPSFVSGRAKEQTTSAHCHQYTPPTLYCSCTPAGCASSVVLSLHPHLRCARP